MFTSFRRANTQSSVITRIPYSSHYPLQSVSSNSGSVMQFRTCLTGLTEQSHRSIDRMAAIHRARGVANLARSLATRGGKFFSQKSFSLDIGHVAIRVDGYVSFLLYKITLLYNTNPEFRIPSRFHPKRRDSRKTILSFRRWGINVFLLIFFFFFFFTW